MAGIIVYNQQSFPEIGLDVSALTAFINTKTNIIPVTGFNTATMLCPDNIHLNITGNTWASGNAQVYIP